MPTDDERDAITSHLFDYGDECDFRPLAARDYGSRARGLSDTESDYDVFFVFVQRPADYALGLNSETYSKSISAEESLLDTEIELHGWDLQRFVGNDGLLGSNPTAIEFCASDHAQYFMSDEPWTGPFERMCREAYSNFKPYALINHYRSMAASNYGKYIEGDYKLTAETSWDDLLYPTDPSWSAIAHESTEGLVVDEQETTIGSDEITVYGSFEQTPYLGTIDAEDAIERGLIEPTTRDPTIKRHLNVLRSLVNARYIELHHEMPTMNYPELLRDCADSEWLPNGVYAEHGALISEKKNGLGEETIEDCDMEIHRWIESELDRDIDPEGHVERQPNSAVIRGNARELYNSIGWE